MITAEEARKLDPTAAREAALERLETLIRAAAASGEKSIRAPNDMCDAMTYSICFKVPDLESVLEGNGFKITQRSEERQFVHLWIEISWDEKE